MLTLTGPVFVTLPRTCNGAVTVLAGKPTKLNSSVFVAVAAGTAVNTKLVPTDHWAPADASWIPKTAPFVTKVIALFENEPPVMQSSLPP